ncbi:MAG TPA: alpha/beta fold hydrolase, partial [Longimicrobiaceae bacterium]|nr:alpha/beta fold hydrolase [Longimicrobiaceae bacterium]
MHPPSMPTLRVNGARLYYEEHGAEPGPDTQTIVFAHGLLWSGRMFDPQVAELSVPDPGEARPRYRCITFDFRGQGRSEVTADGYDMDTLTDDAAALLEALGVPFCHFVGLSMGGFVGMRLALRRPELLRSLVLMETSADPEPAENVPRYRAMGRVVRIFGRLGMRMVMPRVMRIMFGRKFLEDPARAADRRLWRRRGIENDPVGVTRALQGVIDREGVYDGIERITVPTLVMVGDQDVATVAAKAERIAARIPGSRLVVIPGAGHTASVEEPAFVNRMLATFVQTSWIAPELRDAVWTAVERVRDLVVESVLDEGDFAPVAVEVPIEGERFSAVTFRLEVSAEPESASTPLSVTATLAAPTGRHASTVPAAGTRAEILRQVDRATVSNALSWFLHLRADEVADPRPYPPAMIAAGTHAALPSGPDCERFSPGVPPGQIGPAETLFESSHHDIRLIHCEE